MDKHMNNEYMNTPERITRTVLGMGLMEVVLLVPGLSPAAIGMLTVIALYAVFTAIVGRDPHVGGRRVTGRTAAAAGYRDSGGARVAVA